MPAEPVPAAEFVRTPRDVLADRIAQWAGDASVYDYADRLLKDLDSAGFSIGPAHRDDSGVLKHEHDWSPQTYRYCLACDAIATTHSDGAEG